MKKSIIIVLFAILFITGCLQKNKLKQKELKKILLIATGALTNATSNQQGESIPGIAHAIAIETDI